MNPSLLQTQRRLVPRWRHLATTLRSGELASPVKKGTVEASKAIPSDLLTRLEKWRLNPSLITAAELVETCIVEGREKDAVDAARRLVSIDKNAAPLIREQAAKLLARTGNSDDLPRNALFPESKPNAVRALLRIHPHDPLAWVELALEQTIRGAPQAAERSMLVALNLAPNNRHVLRSAARLFLHREDPERALATIARSRATPSDPWLIASEISLAAVAKRHSHFLKIGRTMLAAGGVAPRQVTELAGAVATEELINGNRKKARRCFGQSMIDPTGNSLAQGEWATTTLGGELITEARIVAAFESAEAMAFHLFRLHRFSEVGEACVRWSKNDPFSVRPFEFGAVTAGFIEDFETSLRFARQGLEIRPSSASLLNAAAFAAASLNRVDEAAAAIAKLKLSEVERPQRLIALANLGLIAFRSGDVPTGRKLYAETIDGFRRDGAHEYAARARIYLAREAMLAGTEDWQALLKEAHGAMEKYKESDGFVSLELIEKAAADVAGMSASQGFASDNSQEASKRGAVDMSVKFEKPSIGSKLEKLGKVKESP